LPIPRRAARAPGVHREGLAQQNPYAERFNGTMHDDPSPVVVAGCVGQYRTLRPHRGPGMMAPSVYAARLP
jgi:hypothetical protein